MRIRTRLTPAAFAAVGVLLLLAGPRAAGPSIPTAKPEEVGLSSQRLTRINDMMQRHISHTLPGRPVGEGYGLSVRVLSDAVVGGSRLSDGSFGWSGAFGTHFWVDPKEEIVAILMIQTPIREMRPEFENAVMQAIIE